MRLRLLARAQADLPEAKAWLLREAPLSAEKDLGALLAAIERLERHPRLGPVVRDPVLAARGFRALAHGRYLAFYKVRRATVFVHRVLHQRRSWAKLV